jgi:hypothetical protein
MLQNDLRLGGDMRAHRPRQRSSPQIADAGGKAEHQAEWSFFVKADRVYAEAVMQINEDKSESDASVNIP